ncbi:MAG: S8 family serine peptidase [Candidatus Latescibacterota bacterium]
MSPQVSLEFLQGSWNHIPVTYRANYIIIKLNIVDDSESVIQDAFTKILDHYFETFKMEARIGKWGYFRVFASSGDPLVCLRAEQIAQNEPNVEYAEPDLAMVAPGRPNDPLIAGRDLGDPLYELHQWPVDYLEMPSAWDVETGDDNVLIGFLDSGVPLIPAGEIDIELGSTMDEWVNHEDLNGKRFIAGNNFLTSPYKPDLNDTFGHGTLMIGTIAAKENNQDPTTGAYLGIAGMNWNSPVYICRILDDNGETTSGLFYLAVAEVLEYAAAHEKKVVFHATVLFKDMKLTSMDVGTFEDQCGKLAGYGAIMVLAVGNDKDVVRFPAAAATLKPDLLVAVAAITKDGVIWENSNHAGEVVFNDGNTQHVDVTVAAPGEKVATTKNNGSYYAESGTCIAGAHVTGLISLMWSKNQKMTGEQIIQCLKRTSVIPGQEASEEGECSGDKSPDTNFGYGLIQPKIALECVDWEVTLDSPAVSFVNVPDGDEPSDFIKLAVKSCADITFTVRVSGDDFGISEGTYMHKPGDGPVFQQLVATYSQSMPDVAEAVVTILWDQEPGLPVFEVQITANRVAAANSVIFLAADKSGSMMSASGIGSYTRMDVLKYSTKILIDLIEEESGMGIISFDESAHQVAGLTVIEPGNPHPARAALQAGIDELAADGWTSIGAGIQRSNEDIDSIPADLVVGDETKAVIVLTDGKENRAPFLADIMTEECPYPVYAIGMGSPDSIDSDALIALSSMTGGYTVLTGELDDTSEYEIAGFFNKILTEINGDSVVLDPSFRLRPGTSQEYQIKVTRADKRLDLIVMRPKGAVLSIDVLTPPPGRDKFTLGEDKAEDEYPRGITILNGTRVTRYRLPLPLEMPGGSVCHAGIYRVRVSIGKDPFHKLLDKLRDGGMNKELIKLHGLHYALQANVHSNLRFRARLSQDGMEPGSNILVRAIVTENNLPLNDSMTQVKAHIRHPDGIEEIRKTSLRMPGLYESVFQATMPGVYNFRIVAEGRSSRGDKYQREQLLTGIVRSL